MMTLRSAYNRYHKSHTHKSRTVEDYSTAISHWERLTGDPPIDQVNNLTCRDFKEAMFAYVGPDGRKLAATTIAKYSRELQAIFCTLGPCSMKNKQGLDIIETIPCFPLVKVSDPLVVTAEDEEIAAILKSCEMATWPKKVVDEKSQRVITFEPSEWWLNLVLYLCTFGSRRNEFLALPSLDVDCAKRQITLKPDKNGARNYKPIPHELIPYFLAFQSQRREFFFATPKGQKTLYKQWHLIQKDAGIHVRRPAGSRRVEYFGFHELRKTCGTNWAAISPAAGKHMLGHKSQQVFDRCYTNSGKVARRVIDNFVSPTSLLPEKPTPVPPTPPTGEHPRLRIVG